MLWFVLAGMTALAVLGALWPLVMRRKGVSDAASEIAFYKAQLGEIERDVERGQLPAQEAVGARAEAARRLIAASAAAPAESGAGETLTPRLIAAALVLIFVPLVALALYADLGRPDMPDAPLASRKADVKSAESLEAAIARIEAHLIASPDDGKGWAVIAPVYMRLGRFDEAVNAFRECLRVNGESATRRADYGEALVAAARGVVTADARAAFDKALAEQPDLAEARFYLGLAAEQDGDKAEGDRDVPGAVGRGARRRAVGRRAQGAAGGAQGRKRPGRAGERHRGERGARRIGRRATDDDPRHGRAAGDAPGAERRRREPMAAPHSLLFGAARNGQGEGRARLGAQGAGRRRGGGTDPRRGRAGTGNRRRERPIRAGDRRGGE